MISSSLSLVTDLPPLDEVQANPPFTGTIDAGSIHDNLKAICNIKKTELLFVALFIRMLNMGGRCACIVPDGVLFGSTKAHKALRQELVENQNLQAVISMPSGVFKPYAGVSAAILVFTKTNAGGTEKVWFYDMKSDGFSLDDKRTDFGNDGDITDIINRFHNLANEADRKRIEQSFLVDKEDIKKNDYDLSINRYKEIEYEKVEYDKPEVIMTRLDELAIDLGTTPKTSVESYWNGTNCWVTPAELADNVIVVNDTERKITDLAIKDTSLKPLPIGTILLSSRAPIGKVAITGCIMYCNQGFKNLICGEQIYNKYLFWFLKGKKEYLNSLGRGATFKEISKTIVEKVEIPLPPHDVQNYIADTLDKTQEIIDGHKKQLEELDNLIKATFYDMFGDPVINNLNWDVLKIEDTAEKSNNAIKAGPFGSALKKEFYVERGYKIYGQEQVINDDANYGDYYISEEKYQELINCAVRARDVLISLVGTYGKLLNYF